MRREAASRATLVRDLQALGVREGQILLVRAAAKAIGPVIGGASPATLLRDACLEAVGSTGALVGLTFTGSHFRWRKARARTSTFRPGSPATTGAFAQSILDHPAAVRSQHPTNSFAVIGQSAHSLIATHDHRSTSFAPVSELILAGGQMLLIGCAQSSPGFSTVHAVQEQLGLAERTLMSGWLGAWYSGDEGERSWFSCRDVAGCSMGFSRFYRDYVEAGALKTGHVGAAYSLMIGAQKASQIERSRLEKAPQYALCEDPGCVACGTRTYAPRRMAGLALRMPAKLLARVRRS